MLAAPARAKSGTMRSTGFTMRCTSIGTRECGLIASHTRGPSVEVGNVMVVHHVEMNEVGAGVDDLAHFLAETRAIGGQYRGGNAERGRHAGYNRVKVDGRA